MGEVGGGESSARALLGRLEVGSGVGEGRGSGAGLNWERVVLGGVGSRDGRGVDSKGRGVQGSGVISSKRNRDGIGGPRGRERMREVGGERKRRRRKSTGDMMRMYAGRGGERFVEGG